MSAFKKTIFLSNKESTNKGMAILTLNKQTKGVFCTLKSYNFGKYSDLVLGLKSEDKIYKQNINLDSNIYNFLLNQEINLEKNLGCVLLDTSNNSFTPILWGSEKADNYKSQIVTNLKNSIQKLQNKDSLNSIQRVASEYTSYPKQQNTYINNSNENLTESNNIINNNNIAEEKTIDIVTNGNTYNQQQTNTDSVPSDILDNQVTFLDSSGEAICPVSRSSNYSNNLHQSEIAHVATMSNLFESNDGEIEEIVDKEMEDKNIVSEHKFYNMIAEQLDDLFEKYPREENLENLVENSKWVKIKYEDQDKYYVVGIIYINNDIKYICYGVPGNYYSEPPRELKDYSQWLPTDTLSPYSEGFWVMYQDADTGENVIIN